MRQIFGFALLGGWIALLASSLSDVAQPTGSAICVFVGSSASVPSMFTERPYLAGIVVGVVAGALISVVLRFCGFTMTGQPNNRTTRVVAAGLTGAAIGIGLAVAVAFGDVVSDPSAAGILAIYLVCGVLAYGLSLGAVHTALRLSGDENTRETVRTLAWVVPIGAIAATAAGVGTASLSDFATTESTWIATCTVVVTVASAAFAIGRGHALRRA